jgi:hypothetical protein
MKQAPQHIIELSYISRPVDGGNPHCPTWAHDGKQLIRRTYNWDNSAGRLSNTRHEYHAFKQGKRGEFDPINGEVNAIGRGKFLGASRNQ